MVFNKKKVTNSFKLVEYNEKTQIQCIGENLFKQYSILLTIKSNIIDILFMSENDKHNTLVYL